jgi:hypothetical protein
MSKSSQAVNVQVRENFKPSFAHIEAQRAEGLLCTPKVTGFDSGA